MRKVLVIDPVTATIREENWDGHSFVDLYKWIRTDIVALARGSRGLVIWVDQEGLRKTNIPRWFIPDLYPQPIVGPGVVTAMRGKDVPPGLREVLMEEIKWGLLMNPHEPTSGSA